jgi:hypothetical protein
MAKKNIKTIAETSGGLLRSCGIGVFNLSVLEEK